MLKITIFATKIFIMADFDLIADLKVQTDATSVEKAVQNLQKYDNLLATAGAKAAESFRSSLSYVEKLRVREQELYKQRDAGANQTVEAQRKINKELENTQSALQRVANAQKASQTQQASGLAKLSQSLFGQITAANLLTSAIQKVGQAAKDLVVDIFNATKETEKLQSDLSFFLRGRGLSENAITATISEIKQFAAENPVADLKTTTEGFLALLNASTKIGVNQAIELNKSLVDITAGNIEYQKGLVNVLGQVARQNKIVGNDWFQFSNNGLNLIETLKGLDKFAGKTDQQIKELATKGKINFKDLSDAILDSTAEGGKYFGRSEAAAKTLNGQLAALKDAVFNLEAAFGKGASGGLTDFVAKIVELLNKSREFIEGNEFQDYTNRFSDAVTNVLTPLNHLTTWFVTNSGNGSPLSKYIDFAVGQWEFYGKVIAKTTSIIESSVKSISMRNEYAKYLREQGSTRSFLGVENPLIGMRKDVAGTLTQAEFMAQFEQKQQEKANLARQNEIAQLKEIAALRESALAKDAAKGTFTQNIGQAKALLSGNKITLDTVRKFNSELTKEEVIHLNALLGKYEDVAQKEESAIDKEAAAKLKKQKEFHDNFLKKEIEFNENLQKIINDNNDKLAEIREKDSPNSVEKIKAANERAKQAELRATAERGAEIVKAENEVRKELGKIPADLAKQFAAAKEKIKIIESQVVTKYALLENQEIMKFQKEQNAAKLKSYNEYLKARNEFFQQSEKQLRELENDSLRQSIELSGDKLRLLDYENEQRISKITETFATAQKVNEKAYVDNLITETIYLQRKEQLKALSDKQLLLNEQKFQKELTDYRDNIFKAQIEREQQNIQDRFDLFANQIATERDYAAANAINSGKQSEVAKIDSEAQLKILENEGKRLQENKRFAIENNKTEEEREKITAQIAENERQIAEEKAKGNDAAKEVTKSYISGIESGLNSTFEVINAIETALTRSIDRQIELQKERVTAALELAKKGNAEALTIEEDRLNELEKKRRKFAQAQIAIDTAQRVSAAALAIANVTVGQSTPPNPLSPVLIPIAIASVLASLGAGFAQAQALEKGTLSVQPKNGIGGRKTDDIPTWLNKGEAVIPTETNRKYAPTLEALYYEKVPASALNDFVTNYGKLPKHNFSLPQIRNFSDNSMELVKEIKSLKNELQNMKSKVSISFDANGFTAAMQNTENILDSILGNL